MTTLIGTNPDQIPVNSMLGGMAYQDPDSVSVKNFNYSGTLLGLGNSSIVSTSGDISSTVHANNATGGALAILRAGDGTSSSYYSYLRIVNNDSSPKTWDIGTKGNDDLRIDDGATTRFLVSSGIDHVMFNSGNTSFFIGNGATAGGGNTNDASFNWSLSGAVKLCRNSTLVAEIDSSNNLIIKTTGAIKVSEGTTAERPATPQEGMIRKNSTLNMIEGYVGGEWKEVVTVPATSGVVGRFQSVSGVNLSGSGVYELNINGTVSGINKIEMTFNGVSSNGAGDIFFDIGTSTGGYSPGGGAVFSGETFNTTTSNILNSSASSVTPSNRLRLSTANDSNSVLTGKITLDKHIQGGGGHSFIATATVYEYRPGVGTSITTAIGMKVIAFSSDTLKIKLVADGNQFDAGAVSVNAYTLY